MTIATQRPAPPFTPGPWAWSVNYICPGELKGAVVYIDVDSSRSELAAVSARNVSLQTICEANARLMAAAPDLYEALRDAEQRLHGAGMLGGASDPVCAALAKATA